MRKAITKIISGFICICLVADLFGINVYADTFLCDEAGENENIILENISECFDTYNLNDDFPDDETASNENKEEENTNFDEDIMEEKTEPTENDDDILDNSEVLEEIDSVVDFFDIIETENTVYAQYFNKDYVSDEEVDEQAARLLSGAVLAAEPAKIEEYSKLVEHVTDAMVNRTASFSVTVPVAISDANGPKEFAQNLINDAFDDDGVTTNPKAGDYLLMNLGGWSMSCTYTSTTYYMNFYINYLTTKAQEDKVDATVAQIINNKIDTSNDYTKVKSIHDYVCDNVTYKNENNLSHSTYAALCSGKAVCQGYASMYYRLCREVNLPCRCAVGKANNESHGWNFVRLLNEWYFVDTTFDDGTKSDKYFLKAEKSINSHKRTNLNAFFNGKDNVLANANCVEKDMLKALAAASEYKVNYVLNGGENNAKNPDTHIATKSVALRKPTREGYKFVGWFAKADFSGKKYTSIPKTASDLTFYAKWNPIVYTIKFKSNSTKAVSATGRTKSMTKLNYDETYTLGANGFVSKNGKRFLCWNTRADGKGTSYSDMAKVKNLVVKNKKSITLYAQWGN